MSPSRQGRLGELADELDRLADGLRDAAMDLLRQALHSSRDEDRLEATRREKLLNRARASVEKAARLTRQADGSQEPAEDW